MNVSFDTAVDRRHTASVKWDALEERFGAADLLPMWIADMDFLSPAPVVDALAKRVAHGVFGYAKQTEDLYAAIVRWLEERHGWAIRREWIAFTPGVVAGIAIALHALTKPNDGVIIQPPVYNPFAQIVEANGRQVVLNPLLSEERGYRMDLDDLDRKAGQGARMLILCSPHNPVGRVWSIEELRGLSEIAYRHGLVVVADEIHSDIIYPGAVHTPFPSLDERSAMQSVLLTGPSKAFNLAGLKTSFAVIPNPEWKKAYDQTLERMDLLDNHLFGLVAMEAAYSHGAEWLEELVRYLYGNLDHLTAFLQQETPAIRVIRPQGTYLVWLDCRRLGLTPEALSHLMREEARVALTDGSAFGPGGEGFERINIGCPRSLLDEGITRIARAVQAL